MQFEKAQKSFIDHLQIERGLSPNSIAAYGRDLDRFAGYLTKKDLDFQALNTENLTEYEIALKQEGLALSSINRGVSALKTFYKYLSREYAIADPTTELTANRLPRKLPKALTISEIESLLRSTERVGELTALRDRAILEVLYGTGARVSEVVGLNLGDLGKSMLTGDEVTTLKLRGKGSKERIVPLGSFAKEAIENYMVRLRPMYVEKSKSSKAATALFLNSRGGRLSRTSAWQIVTDAAEATGLSGKVSPHVFRHSYATHLLDGGADIRVVQELLGHSSVTTTQIYTLITIDKVRQAYASAHPRAI
ncbi:MAG: site-specific tyrosine recombinase XerD [Actinomycetota bacterium]